MDILLVFHNGIIGANEGNKYFIAGSYNEKNYKEKGLEAVNKLSIKYKDKEVRYIVPNRFIRVLTENNINSTVHMQENIPNYLRLFNFIEKFNNNTKNYCR